MSPLGRPGGGRVWGLAQVCWRNSAFRCSSLMTDRLTRRGGEQEGGNKKNRHRSQPNDKKTTGTTSTTFEH